MKKLLLQTITCCAVLLPLGQLQARSFGGFKPGKTFRLEVADRTVAKTTILGGTVLTNVVPSGIPKFSEGQLVKFTIGSKGQLTGNGFNIAFSSGSATSNTYANAVSGTSIPDQGIINKNFNGKPIGGSLVFVKISGSGFSTVTTMVTYTFNLP